VARQEIRYPRLGEQIDRLVRSLAAVKGWKMTRTMSHICQYTNYGPDMVHRWRQGKIRPLPETLEILAKIGKEEVNLSRDWGESMLNSGYHPHTSLITDRLWGPKAIRTVPCNLPSLDRTHLIGRQAAIKRLLTLLSPPHAASLITVDGIGGVGKTSLVLEVAYRCWKASTGEEPDPQAPLFDAIIFVSAKQQYLTPDGLLPSNEAKRTLRDIFREIASTLDRFEITNAAPQEQFALVYKALQQRTLLIVDNMETMEDKQEIISFLYELPHSVKVVITTRERVLSFSPIRLEQLSREEAINLIEKEAQEKETEITREEVLELYRHIGGIPAALVYAIGQIVSGYSVATVLARVPQANSDVARFCFEGSVEPLRGHAAHRLLMAMAMNPKPPIRIAVAHIAGLTADQIIVEEGLTQLRKLSLVCQQEGRYIMLPLTREYALSELAAHASFEREARRLWVEWYLNFTQEYGGKDWRDWNIRYDRIEEEWENLLTVFDWCATHEQYEVIQTFWQERHLVKFAHIYGYWEDRLFWLKWLIQAAEKRGDWSNAVRSMINIGSTLIMMGQLEDANAYLQHAWSVRKCVDPQAQLILAQKITYLYLEKKEFSNALSWLCRAKELLDTTAATVEEPERSRRFIDFLSYKGLIFFKQKDYQQAELCFKEIMGKATAIGWQRVGIFAQTHLANIAAAQDRLEEAEALLQANLLVSKDKRLAAFHKHTFAYFYQKMGKPEEARHLAKEARDGFERLGMRQEAKETDELLQQLKG
jgi:tetratricopeptide (TPR) repeat protein